MKTAAVLFGAVFLAAGLLGFVPAAAPEGHLLGIFHVNAAHNLVHIASGLAALACAWAGPGAARGYFRVFGIVYGLVAALGFLRGGDGRILGVLAVNAADNWLHAAIAVASLYLGFSARGEEARGKVRPRPAR